MTTTNTTRYWPPGALLSHTFTTPRFAVAPFLPYGGIGVLHGPPGVGKSQLALTMCLAVARGENFLVPDFPATQGRALYVQLNMPMPEQQKRLQDSGATLHDEIGFLAIDKGQFDVMTLMPSRDGQLAAAVHLEPDLVVIDTLRDSHIKDEIDSATVTAVYGNWRKLFETNTNIPTLLFVHHDRKLALTNGAPPERFWAEAARGSSTWLANADAGMHLTDAKGTLTLFWSKTRVCAPIAPLAVRLNSTSLLVEPTDPNTRQKLMTWLVENPSAQRREAVQHLTAEGLSYARAKELVAEHMGAGRRGRPRTNGK